MADTVQLDPVGVWEPIAIAGRGAGPGEDAVVVADERMVEGVRKGCFAYFEAFPDMHVSLDELIAEGESVFLRSTLTGTHDGEYKGIPATGRHVATECAEVFRIRDDRFVGYWCLTNVAGLMRQLTEEPAVEAVSTATT